MIYSIFGYDENLWLQNVVENSLYVTYDEFLKEISNFYLRRIYHSILYKSNIPNVKESFFLLDQDILDQINQIKNKNKPIIEFNIEVYNRICDLLKKCRKMIYIKNSNNQIYFYILSGTNEFNQLIESKKNDITKLLDQYGTELDIDVLNNLINNNIQLVKVLTFKDNHFKYI